MADDPLNCEPCAPGGSDDPGIKAFGLRIGLSLACAGQAMIFSLGYNNAQKLGEAPPAGSPMYLLLHGGLVFSSIAVAFLLGRPLLRQTARAVADKRVSVESLFVLSGFGAFAGSLLSTIRGTGSVYYEVVSIVFCVYAIGRQIGVIQKGRVAQAVSSFKQAFDFAVVTDSSGSPLRKHVRDVTAADRVIVQPGEPVAVDGMILSGKGYIRETAITGEPVPVIRETGDRVTAGTWSLDGSFVIRPVPGQQRMIDRIIDVLQSPTQRVSKLQETADQLMQYFVPLVCLTAAGTFLGWLFFTSAIWWDALFNSMAVLLVACPCALGLAMPAGIWGGLYHLSQRGLIGRNGHLIDALAECDMIVFDKTGTLTEFNLEADTSGLLCDPMDAPGILGRIAAIASHSPHPVSKALSRLAPPAGIVSGLIVHPGQGLEARVDDELWKIGEMSLLDGIPVQPHVLENMPGKPVYVACDNRFLGVVCLRERLRPEVEGSISALQALNCSCHVLSGDPAPVHTTIAGLAVRYGLTPDMKLSYVKTWINKGKRILFVGDGVNDLPAMQACDASLAIDLGAAMTTEFADGLLVQGRVASLPSAVRFARRLKHSLSGNMRFAIAYNVLGMTLAAAGVLHPVVAALLMVGSSLIVSLRALRVVEAER